MPSSETPRESPQVGDSVRHIVTGECGVLLSIRDESRSHSHRQTVHVQWDAGRGYGYLDHLRVDG